MNIKKHQSPAGYVKQKVYGFSPNGCYYYSTITGTSGGVPLTKQ